MGLTGVIYAAIVVAWAAYLVPLALRRHDQAARSHSIQRFSSAMRVLSRRGAISRGRVVVTPPRPQERVVRPSPPTTPAAVEAARPPAAGVAAEAVVAPRRPSRRAMRAAAVRRRRVLYVLLTPTLITGSVAAFALVPLWSVAVPVAVVAGFLVVARRQVRRGSDSYWTQASEASPEPSNVVRRRAARVDASHGSARAGAARTTAGATGSATSGDGTGSDDEPTITLSADGVAANADLDERRAVAVSMATADGESLWDPVPVTLPTYVDKPAVKRSIRTIDLGEPGTWSSGRATVRAGASGAVAEGGLSSPGSEQRVDQAAVGETDPGEARLDEKGPRVVNG